MKSVLNGYLNVIQINLKSVTSTIPDPDVRGTMIFAWWMACISDAYGSAYHRRKPLLDEDDYDIDFYTVEDSDENSPSTTTSSTTSPREQLEVSPLHVRHIFEFDCL
jgi:hypothetical protein